MAVYMIIDISVHDPGPYAEYVSRVAHIVRRYGGRYLVRGGPVTPMFGGWRPERIIVIEFDSHEDVRRCFQSPEYLALAPLRERSTESRAIVVDGLPPSPDPSDRPGAQ